MEGDPLPLQQAAVELDISIHSLRVEGDIIEPELFDRVRNFNPLPPCGGRLEGDKLDEIDEEGADYFNPLPPCGGRPDTVGRSALS